MNALILSYLIITILFLVCFFIYAYFWRREIDIRDNSTAKIEGRVVDYRSWTNVKVPIVAYMVGNREYRQFLSYSAHVSAPGMSFYTKDIVELRRLLLDTTTLYNVNLLPYSFKELWPIGSTMIVFYNPQNPKRGYVERYAGMFAYFKYSTIFCIVAQIIFTIIIGLIALFR